jgi:hypothetical protein
MIIMLTIMKYIRGSYCIEGSVGSTAGLDDFERRKFFLILNVIFLRPSL